MGNYCLNVSWHRISWKLRKCGQVMRQGFIIIIIIIVITLSWQKLAVCKSTTLILVLLFQQSCSGKAVQRKHRYASIFFVTVSLNDKRLLMSLVRRNSSWSIYIGRNSPCPWKQSNWWFLLEWHAVEGHLESWLAVLQGKRVTYFRWWCWRSAVHRHCKN